MVTRGAQAALDNLGRMQDSGAGLGVVGPDRAKVVAFGTRWQYRTAGGRLLRSAVLSLQPKWREERTEHRAIRLLEAAGYVCTRTGAGRRVADSGQGRHELSFQVEREQITELAPPANCTREVWRFPTCCRSPLIKRLSSDHAPGGFCPRDCVASADR